MVFSSTLFLLYFLPIFLLVYHITPQKLKNYVILAFSVFFYAWGAPKFVFLLIGEVVVNYFIINKMYVSEGKQKRWLLGISVILNVGLLLYFKYANFFVENTNAFLGVFGAKNIAWTKVVLPIGISFFTFQNLTYSIDVYRGLHAPLKKVTDYLMYIILFPQLIAGPIVRFNEIADQIIDRKEHETSDEKLLGFFRFVVGLSKKVLIANAMGEQVDKIFAMQPADMSTSLAWFGAIAYSFQIYYDFSGYSDMAIGIGRMMGFKFPENFNNPYISRNITEFWRRWHITLGRWMRDYLYIPLGGSRVKTKRRLYFNLWVVFIISGFWHGAAWNFILWGVFHGFFLILDRMFLLKFTERIGKVPSIILTYILVLIGWVLFRAESLQYAVDFTARMFAFDFGSLHFDKSVWTMLVLGFFFAFIGANKKMETISNSMFDKPFRALPTVAIYVFAIAFFILCESYIASSGFNPFIYFRF